MSDFAIEQPKPAVPPVSAQLLSTDAELVRLSRVESKLRLRIGELLDALFEREGHHELGFPSIDAYVRERCEQSASWGREIRALARRLRERGLTKLRRAILAGELGASMAELLARYATPETESDLIRDAQQSTIRVMRAKLTGKEES